MVVYLQLDNIKRLATQCISSIRPVKAADNRTIEMCQCEHEVIVDQQLRDKSSTTIV